MSNITTEQAVAYIAAALVHLEEFSIPKLGTFRKVTVPARIIPQKKIIMPPFTRYELTPGDKKVHLFVNFLVNHYGLREDSAYKLAQELGEFLYPYIQSIRSLEIPGFGTLVKSGKHIKFKHQISPEDLLLEPIPLKSVAVTAREKSSSTSKSKGEGKLKRIAIFSSIILLALFLSVSILYGIFYPKFYPLWGIKIGFLHKWHNMEDKKTPKKKAKLYTVTKKDTTKKEEKDTLLSEAELNVDIDTDKELGSLEKEIEKIDIEEDITKDITASTEPAPEPKKKEIKSTSILDKAVDPKTLRGPLYLVIVAASNEEAKINEVVNKMKRKGYNVTIIKHPKLQGWYRIAIGKFYDSAQAEELKNTIRMEGVPDAWVWKIQ